MPKLVRLYIKHVVIGLGLSAVFIGALLWFNVANLGHLILSSDKGWIALWMMFVANGVVFSGVQFGIAVMGMAENDDDGGKGLRDPEPLFAPLPVVANPRSDRSN